MSADVRQLLSLWQAASLCLKVSHTDILSCYKWREWSCSSLVVVDTLDFVFLGETTSDFIPRPVFIPDDHWEVRLYLRAFSISACDGKWLSIGVDLNASSAFCGLDLVIAALLSVFFTV